MRHPLRPLLVAALLALLVAPAATAAPTRVDALPAAAPFTRARFDFAIVAGGQAFAFGRGEFESPTRLHLTLKAAPFEGLEDSTVEIVMYDGVTYSRENDSTQWYIEPGDAGMVPGMGVPTDVASELPADTPITLVGERDVAGTLTDQYQLWISGGEDELSFSTIDLFLGRQPAYLQKLQVSVYESIEAELALLGLDYRFYDFDSPAIVVGRPAGAIERPEGQAAAPDGGIRLAGASLSAVARALR